MSLVRVTRFVSVSLLLGAALAALLAALVFSSLALWLLRSRSRSVVLSPFVPSCLPAVPVRLCLPAAAPLPPAARVGRFAAAAAFESLRLQFASLGLGFAASSRVLVCPVRAALPAAAPVSVGALLVAAAATGVSGCRSAAGADLAVRAAALSESLVAAASAVSVPVAAEVVVPLCPFAGVSVTQLRRLAVSRGVRGVSRLRRAELVALLA